MNTRTVSGFLPHHWLVKSRHLILGALVGCTACHSYSSPTPVFDEYNDSVSVRVRPSAYSYLDSMSRYSVDQNTEQIACIERFTIEETLQGKLVTLVRVGPSPITVTSDSLSLGNPLGYTHLCYAGQPSIHTHPHGIYWPSPTDYRTAWEHEAAPFAALLVSYDDGRHWEIRVHSVRP